MPAAQADLSWENDSRIRLDRGRRLLIEVLPGADPRSVRLGILGPGLSLLMAQRGRLVLHASVVEKDGAAIAFIGGSGAGKSTLAAAFCKRGYRLVTDNLLVVRFVKNKALAVPGFARFKLWPDSADALGRGRRRLRPIQAGCEKGWLAAGKVFSPHPVPLRRLYVISPSKRPRIRRLGARRQLYFLMKHSAGYHSARNAALWPSALELCQRLLRSTELRALARGGRLDTLNAAFEAVEADLKRFTT